MDKIYEFNHKSGLPVIFIPKPGFSERYAMFTTKFGSADSCLTNLNLSSVGKMDVPQGIAHFLEHKLFEQKDGDVMSEYAKMGVRPNAFTSSTQTSYLFSCTNNFEPALKLLLNYVQNPYFTPENVDKEKGIIGQEINMYLDNPDSVIYMNFLRGLYVNNPVRNDIAGSIESISAITPDILYLLYNTFYTPENMVLVIVGDEEPSEIRRIVEESMEEQWVNRNSTGYAPYNVTEPMGIFEKYTEHKAEVSTPSFMFGYKDNQHFDDPIYLAKKEIEVKILLEMLFGRCSDFYGSLYSEGIINESFYSFYELERGFAYTAFGGESRESSRVIERIQKRIHEAKHGNISETDFSRIKRGSYGSFIKGFNSVEGVCRLYTNAALADVSVFDYFSLYDKIDFNSVVKRIKLFDESKSAISVIKPENTD